MATLHWQMREVLPEMKEEGRLNILIAMLLRANIRLRCYPSTEQLMSDTGLARATTVAGRQWLIERRFVVRVPYKLRVDDERKLPVRQSVYQMTGVFTIEGEVQQYLYMTPDAFTELQARVRELEQFKVSLTESSLTESSVGESSVGEPKGISSIGVGSIGEGDASVKDDSSSPDGDATPPDGKPDGAAEGEKKPANGDGTEPSPGSGQPSPYPLVWEAVKEVWGHDGARTGLIAGVIAGCSTKKGWAQFNFEKPGTPDGVRVFKDWYAQTCKGAALPEDGEGIQTWYGKMRIDWQQNPEKAVFEPLRKAAAAQLPASAAPASPKLGPRKGG